MKKHSELLLLAKRVQAIAENGLYYSEGDYDLERYTDLEEISSRMFSLLTNASPGTIQVVTPERNGYRTPKVDVRAIVFNDNHEILMVKERVDSRWSLPGGWCDIGYSPTEIAEKEAFEEAGIKVKARRVLAIFDKRCHDHPEDLFYTYKIFMECEPLNHHISTGMETLEVDFFKQDKLPPLSTPRNTVGQINKMFDFHFDRIHWPLTD